ncbi:hypothetical protein CFH99_11105 [Nocardioides aromaticivorans]|uniref:Uncharacterized protein n=2 Tax=Nocardioides aromaticivorans TaxID=200618 RepID=A0ABX7PKA8_9ACTN|nr:hypothetical protein CFH99_11105 [Nocardioides aromaticivorans]
MSPSSLHRLMWRVLATLAAIVLVALVLDLVGIDDTPTDRTSLTSSLVVLAAVVAGGALGDRRRSRQVSSTPADPA